MHILSQQISTAVAFAMFDRIAAATSVRHAVRNTWDLPDVPTIEEVRRRGVDWSPYRTYAAALLWGSLSRT